MSELIRAWKLRNATAAALELAVDHVAASVRDATHEQLVEFIDSFSPARATGPEWVGTLDRLVEQLWETLGAGQIAALEAEYRSRGPIWMAVANSFAMEHGERLRAMRWRPHGARRAAVVLR